MPTPPSLTPLSSHGEAKTSAQAVWSLVLGILSIGCLWLLGSIPAILLGVTAVRNIDRSGGTLKGRGIGIAGIVTGSVGIFSGFVAVGILASAAMPAYNGVRAKAEQTKEMSHIRQLSLACRIYAMDHDGDFPATLAKLVESGDAEAFLLTSQTGTGGFFLYRPGMKDTSPDSEVFLASPAPIRGKRIVGFSGGNVEAIPEDQFQSDYAHLFP